MAGSAAAQRRSERRPADRGGPLPVYGRSVYPDANRTLRLGYGKVAGYEEDIRDQFEGSIARGLARRRELERAAREGAVRDDAVQRRGWIAFPDYFEEDATCEPRA